jgi:hypothetical protein
MRRRPDSTASPSCRSSTTSSGSTGSNRVARLEPPEVVGSTGLLSRGGNVLVRIPI